MKPTKVEEVQEVVRGAQRILPHGGRTKPALAIAAGDVLSLDVKGLSGILEYDPSEYTFTALAGTPVREVEAELSKHGQYLPFDPPLANTGATLGGTIAAGLSGPERFRYGGLRDFLIGVRFVDGTGRMVRGGGKVVKNAAGFDFPKLLVGSLGRLGILVEVTFKVFPRAERYSTLRVPYTTVDEAASTLQLIGSSALDLQALDLQPPGTIMARVAGVSAAIDQRLSRLERFLERPGEVLPDEEEAKYWSERRDFSWVPTGAWLVKVPLTPSMVAPLEKRLVNLNVERHYSVGGQVAWLGVERREDFETVHTILAELQLRGLTMWLTGSPRFAHQSLFCGRAAKDFFFAKRVQAALDPHSRFLEFN